MQRPQHILMIMLLLCSLSGCKQGLSKAFIQQSLDEAHHPKTHRLKQQLSEPVQETTQDDFSQLFQSQALVPVALTLRCAAYPDEPLQLKDIKILEQIKPENAQQKSYRVRAEMMSARHSQQHCQQNYLLEYTHGQRHSWVANKVVITPEPHWTLTAYQNLMTQVWRVEALSKNPPANWQADLAEQINQLGLSDTFKLQPDPSNPLQARLYTPFEDGLSDELLQLLQAQQGFELKLIAGDQQQAVGIDYRDLKTARFNISYQYAVEVSLTAAGKAKLKRVSTENIGQMLGIFLGETLLSAPKIQAPILGGELIIEGNFSAEEAKLLARQLAFKPLPFGLQLTPEQILPHPEAALTGQ